MAKGSSFLQTPPPPYEKDRQHQHTDRELGLTSGASQETEPKLAAIDGNQALSSVERQEFKNQKTSEFNGNKQELPNERRVSTSSGHPHRRKSAQDNCGGAGQHSQFVESLSAPKKFLSSITVEPLAFMAILALYIEFPSIQDLIYTKICLQVIAQYPNLTSSHYQSTITAVQPVQLEHPSLRINSTGIRLFELSSFNQTANYTPDTNSQLPSNGRIQQPVSNNTSLLATNLVSEHLLCDRLNKTAIPKDIRQEIIDGDSLFWLKYQITICLLCGLSSPYWGGMSDKIGRLIPLNVAIITAALSNLISLTFGLLISLNSHTVFGIEWLYLGAVITGISGGQAVVIVSSFSFISDNTSSESRSKRVTVLESVIFLSHSVGFYVTKHIMSLGLNSPGGGSWPLNRHFVAFGLCTSLNLICVIYSFLKLRHHRYHRFLNNFEREQQEVHAGAIQSFGGGHTGRQACRSKNTSLDSGNHSTTNMANDRMRELTSSTPDDLDGPVAQSDKKWTDWAAFLTVAYYKQTYLTATKRRESRIIILLLLLCGFISAMTLACLMSLLYIYLRMDPINWTTSEYSSWNSIAAITQGVALVGLTLCMKFVKSWDVPDPLVSAIGYLSKGSGLLMVALAQNSTIVRWALLAFVFSEFSMPPIRSLLSKLVVREEVGKIYSCLAAMQSICFLFGNIVFYLAYTSLGLQAFFRLSFLVVAGFQFAAVIIMLLIYTTLRRNAILV